jgi:hypothetical protein
MWTVATVVEQQTQVERGTITSSLTSASRNPTRTTNMLAPAANAQPQYV